MADPTATLLDWDATNHQCVANPATGLRRFDDIQAFIKTDVEGGDQWEMLAKKFIAAAAEIQNSLASQNLLRLYTNQDYRTILLAAIKQGYVDGIFQALANWRTIFEDFIDQMLVAGTNAIEDPAAFVVGTAATAIQAVGKNPLADAAPAADKQLNAWIDQARKSVWAGVVPPLPTDIPDDDLAQAKASFIVDLFSQLLQVIADPFFAPVAALSYSEVKEQYQEWQNAEESQQAGLVSVLLRVVCEPDVLGYNLGLRHGQALVNTIWIVALRVGEWLPQPFME